MKINLRNISKQDVLFYAAFLFFVAYAWYLHIRASFFFPVPWDDEEFFLWQALAIQKSNTLFQEVLNPERHLIFKPPVYMILMGLLFKIFGFTYQFARDFSFLFVIAGSGFLAYLAKSLRIPILGVILCGLFLINRYFVAIGNLARMEALIFVIVMASFFLITKRHYWKALILLLFTLLVHPNGAYFLLAGGLLVSLRIYMNQERITFQRSDLFLFLTVLAAFFGYALYCFVHSYSFRHDLGDQFHIKFSRDIIGSLTEPFNTHFFLLALLCFIVILIKDQKVLHFPVLAAAAKLPHAIGQEFFYEFYTSFAFLCLSLSVIHMTCLLLETLPKGFTHKSRLVLKTCTIGCVLLLNFSMRMLDYPVMGRLGHAWSGMLMPDKSYAPYMPKEDKKRVGQFLRELAQSKGPIYVEFRPFADSLFFESLRSKMIKFYQPLYYAGKPKTPYIQVYHYNERLSEGRINSLVTMFKSELSQGNGEILLDFSSKEQRWYVVIYKTPADLPQK